jgi:hypothetical protein
MPNQAPTKEATKKGDSNSWFLDYYLYISLFCSILIFIIGYLVFLGPKIGEVRRVLEKDLTREIEREQKLLKNLEQLVSIEEEIKKISLADINKIHEMLPDGPDLPNLIATVEGLAKASGSFVEGFDLAEIQPTAGGMVQVQQTEESIDFLPEGIRHIDVNLRVESNQYPNVKLLLSNMEKSLRLLDITGISYDPKAQGYTVTFRTYYKFQN